MPHDKGKEKVQEEDFVDSLFADQVADQDDMMAYALADLDDDDLGYDDQDNGDYVLHINPRLNEKEYHFVHRFEDMDNLLDQQLQGRMVSRKRS